VTRRRREADEVVASVEREVLLTLTDEEHAELVRNVGRLRRKLRSPSNTAVILEAIRMQPGATIGDLGHERQAKGCALDSSHCSSRKTPCNREVDPA
jgi:hypothetical protein